jgi:hypothetical protein
MHDNANKRGHTEGLFLCRRLDRRLHVTPGRPVYKCRMKDGIVVVGKYRLYLISVYQ